jgi:hypothetical protein
MIHLIGGESARGTLAESSVPGEKFSIDDILMEGPVQDGLQSESSWDARADYLERYFAISKSEYLAGRAVRDAVLRGSLSHDEVVLWFEFDLYCQVSLLYYIDWFRTHAAGQRLTLICPETVPGRAVFRGLGELIADELEALFPGRVEVSADHKRIAQAAWAAYGSEDPRAVEAFLKTDTSELPLLAPALRAHLDRFPSKANGLGILGRKTLELLSDGPIDFPMLFSRVTSTPEIFRHGIGDLPFQSYLDMLASGPSPLIVDNGSVEITDAGRNVIDNRADAIQLNGIDLWYGGVHLTASNQWRFDGSHLSFTR